MFFNLFELQTFFEPALCSIRSDVINFQHIRTSFAVFQSFTNLFRELNDREIENHSKMKHYAAFKATKAKTFTKKLNTAKKTTQK